MYAVLTDVSIAPGQFEGAQKVLKEQIVPRAKQAQGFVRGYWTVRDDSRQGTSMTVYQTKQDAENAVTMIRTTPPPPGVTINSLEVRQIVADA
jgi:hypothetical protein